MIFVFLCFNGFSDAYAPHYPTIDVPGTRGMGGPFIVDDDTAFSMLTNPAVITGVLNTWIWPGVAASFSGPIGRLLSASAGENAENSIMKAISAVLGEDDKLFLEAGATLPLTFGNIIHLQKLSMAWGVFNSVFAGIKMPSLTYGEVNLGFDITAQYSLAVKLVETARHLFTFGFSVSVFAQVDGAYKGIPTDVLSYYWDVPTYLNIGASLDIGIFYKFAKVFMLGVMVDNAIVPTISLPFTSGTILQVKSQGDLTLYLLPMNLKLGVGIDIPVEWGRKIISRWRVFLEFENLLTQDPGGTGKILSTFMYSTDLNAPHPLLCLSAGMQIKIYDVIDIRLGLSDMLPAVGFGFDLNPLLLNISFYGRELSKEVGGNPQANVALSLSFYN